MKKSIHKEPIQLDLFEDLFDKESLEAEYNSNNY